MYLRLVPSHNEIQIFKCVNYYLHLNNHQHDSTESRRYSPLSKAVCQKAFCRADQRCIYYTSFQQLHGRRQQNGCSPHADAGSPRRTSVVLIPEVAKNLSVSSMKVYKRFFYTTTVSCCANYLPWGAFLFHEDEEGKSCVWALPEHKGKGNGFTKHTAKVSTHLLSSGRISLEAQLEDGSLGC